MKKERKKIQQQIIRVIFIIMMIFFSKEDAVYLCGCVFIVFVIVFFQKFISMNLNIYVFMFVCKGGDDSHQKEKGSDT